jgi:hypothetical protein
MATKTKTWVVLCLQDTPATEYPDKAAAMTAAQTNAEAVSGTRNFLVYELVGGFSPVNEAAPIEIM